MKSTLLLLFVGIWSVQVSAQNWLTDFETATEKAKSENKILLLVFQGSDWCAPCIRLDQEILSSEAFQMYAKENAIMVKADFPRKKKNRLSEEQQIANAQLASKYNTKGAFPLVVIFSPQGEILGETGYVKTTPQKYIELIRSITDKS